MYTLFARTKNDLLISYDTGYFSVPITILMVTEIASLAVIATPS